MLQYVLILEPLSRHERLLSYATDTVKCILIIEPLSEYERLSIYASVCINIRGLPLYTSVCVSIFVSVLLLLYNTLPVFVYRSVHQLWYTAHVSFSSFSITCIATACYMSTPIFL